MHRDSDNPHDELSWLAYCYVSGELSPADVVQFEMRLDDDQAAREAVAAAVLLIEAALLIEAEPTLQRDRVIEAAQPAPAAAIATAGAEISAARAATPHRWLVWAGGLSLAAAASVALIVARWGGLPWFDAGDPPVVESPEARQQRDLAIVWSELHGAAGDEGEANADSPELVAESTASVEADPESFTPAWLLSAVSAEERGPTSTPMEQMQ